MPDSSKYAGAALAVTVGRQIQEQLEKQNLEQRIAGLDEKEFVLLDATEIKKYPQNRTSDDMHIFLVGQEGAIKDSVCGWYEIPVGHHLDYANKKLKAPEMRKEVAEIGRKVCGTCVSTLYSDRDKSKQ